MSTRCQIGIYSSKEDKIEDFEVLLYRHSDGYPGTPDGEENGVLADIVPFLKWWTKGRGISDTEYTGARLSQFLCDGDDKWSRGQGHLKDGDFTGEIGHGISNGFHGDIEFFYKIYPNAIEVYEVPFDVNPNDFKLVETIGLK